MRAAAHAAPIRVAPLPWPVRPARGGPTASPPWSCARQLPAALAVASVMTMVAPAAHRRSLWHPAGADPGARPRATRPRALGPRGHAGLHGPL